MYGRCKHEQCNGVLYVFTDPLAWVGRYRDTVLKCMLCGREEPLPAKLDHLRWDKPRKEEKVDWGASRRGRKPKIGSRGVTEVVQ